MKNASEILERLPKSKALLLTKPAARAFYHCLLRGDDPISVIDDMMHYYEKMNGDIMQELESFVMRYGVLKSSAPQLTPQPPEPKP